MSIIPTLLEVVELTSLPDCHLSFSTRAVRIIDILTSINFGDFNTHGGILVIVRRLVHEVKKCEPFIKSREAGQNGRRFVIHHYRSALIKSLLNFLKRAVVDSTYGNHVRGSRFLCVRSSSLVMEGDLPEALATVIRNPQFFGSSLLYCGKKERNGHL